MQSLILMLLSIVAFMAISTVLIANAIKGFTKKRTDNALSGEVDKKEAFSPIYKKYPSADLATWRRLLSNIGLVGALGLTIVIINYRVYEDIKPIEVEVPVVYTDELAEIPVTTVPPPPVMVVKTPEIKEVPDDEVLEEAQVQMEEEPQEQVVYGPPSDGPVGPPVAAPVAAPVVEDEEPLLFVEEMPAPDGGMGSFYAYLAKNMKYPEQAKRLGIEGRVFVQFVVEKNGKITDIKIQKGIGAGCDEEAVRVLSSHPAWKPGKQRGRPVRVKMVIPIMFKLAG